MDYERGLTLLKQLVVNSDQYEEFLIYEQQLRDNLVHERLYGPTEQSRSSRAWIVSQLNRLALQIDEDFNDLCLNKPASRFKQNQGLKNQNMQQSPGVPIIPPQKSGLASRRSKAYIGFSPQDKRYLNELHVHLDQYVRKGSIDYWDSTKIIPGANWRNETVNALNTTKVAILLISANFLASDPITRDELPSLLKAANKEGTIILCVLLRPCAFQDSELAQFLPVNTTPLSSMSKDRREEVWDRVAVQVRDLLQASL